MRHIISLHFHTGILWSYLLLVSFFLPMLSCLWQPLTIYHAFQLNAGRVRSVNGGKDINIHYLGMYLSCVILWPSSLSQDCREMCCYSGLYKITFCLFLSNNVRAGIDFTCQTV